MSNIDAILYINLARRIDRNEHVLHEINKLGKDASYVHRIDAVKREPGALGCSLSHVKALQYALDHPEWNNVLVLEDDFTFHSTNTSEIVKSIDELCNHSTFDVCLLSYNPDGEFVDTTHPHIKKIMRTQTTASYLITKAYIPTLLQNMTESSTDMEKYGPRHTNCIDVHWSLLQSRDHWFCTFPAIGYQYGSYSDVQMRYMLYGC